MVDAHPIPTDPRFQNLTDRTFGRLTVVAFAGRRRGNSLWHCVCKCGGATRSSTNDLKTGHTNSCGCYLSERVTKHGCAGRGKMSPEYMAWSGIIQRCTNDKSPNYHNYGGRGIKVCDRWLTFENFLADMGRRPPGTTIDRKNNDGNYEPGNCRWATQKEQCRNNRRNRRITFDGETLTIIEWSERTGLPFNLIRKRLHRGWPPEKIFTTPPQRS